MDKKSEGIVLKKKHIIIALLIFLLLLIGGIVIGLNWNNWFGENSQPVYNSSVSQITDPDIDPNAGHWTSMPPEENSSEQVGIKIPGYPSITIPADQKDITVLLLNPEGNPCYFTFELVLKDTNETLYKSKLVPPGQAITNITLSRPLSAGEYNAVIKISTTSLKDQSAMNGANVETVLIVK
ncbi:MAG: hypothetical protein ACI4M3_04020 [Acutalibacteraceae bacterium]